MPESPSFLEQFDRSGLYAKRQGPRGPGTGALLSISILVALLVIGLGAVAFLFVLRDDAKSIEQWLDEGLTAHVEGDLVDAAGAYREVLLLDPDNKFAHYNLGLIAHTQGRSDEAESRYRQALTTDPVYEPALFNLAILRYEADDYAEAVELYQLVLSASPDNAKAHLNLGYALRDLGRDDEAARELARAISLDPTLRAGVLEAGSGNSEEAGTTTTTTTTAAAQSTTTGSG